MNTSDLGGDPQAMTNTCLFSGFSITRAVTHDLFYSGLQFCG